MISFYYESSCFSLGDFNSSPSPVRKLQTKPSESPGKYNGTEAVSTSNYKLSYEDYLNSWKGIGTTKTTQSSNPFGSILPSEFDQDEYDIIKHEVDIEINRQLSEHQLLMYGHFENDSNRDKLEKLRANKIQLLKDIHGNKSNVKSEGKHSMPVSRLFNQISEFFRLTDS